MIGLAPRRQFEVRGGEKLELYPANPTVRLHLTQRIFFLKISWSDQCHAGASIYHNELKDDEEFDFLQLIFHY